MAVPLALTLALLATRLFATPPLSDPLGRPLPPALHLQAPPLYFLLAPLFTLWDGVSMLSMTRLRGFLLGLLLIYLLWRAGKMVLRRRAHGKPRRWLAELASLAVALLLLAGFILGGLLWHRPMLALAGVPADDVVADFHSHTNVSHDVRGTLMRGFDTAANLRWHRRAGFDLVFVTDHNTVAGLHPRLSAPDLPRLCPGIEVSAWHSHIVLLGDTATVDRSRYNGSLEALLTLLRTSDSAYGAVSVASLPEYQENLRDRLGQLAAAGLDGFEIVNAAPKANELTRAERDSVIGLARRATRFVIGVSDSHGWGATSMVWNLVSVPRWRDPAGDPCGAVLRALGGGFAAVRIVERHRVRPDSGWPSWLTPVAVVWEGWRSMGWLLTGGWLLWIWGVALLPRRR
jgi:hypothetical protein